MNQHRESHRSLPLQALTRGRRGVALVAMLCSAALAGCTAQSEPPPFDLSPVPGDLSRATLTADRTTLVANGVDRVTLTVALIGPNGRPLTGVFVTFAATGSDNLLFQPAGPTDASGMTVAQFATTAAGAKTITASAGVAGARVTLPAQVLVNATAVPPTSASTLAFLTGPASSTAGSALAAPLRLAAQNAAGQTVTTATGTAVLALRGGAAGATLTCTGSLSAAIVDGVASFPSCSVDKAGTGYTLVASAPGLTSATSAAFDITPAAASTLAFTNQPTESEAGASIAGDIRVEVRDRFANRVTAGAVIISVALGNGPTDGALLDGTTQVTTVGGLGRFTDLILYRAFAGYTLVATAGGVSSATSTAFAVRPSMVDHFSVSDVPETVVAGAAFSATVTALDLFENVATTYVGTVVFRSDDSTATVPAAFSFGAGDAGVHTFSGLVLRLAGPRELTVADDDAVAGGLATTTVTPAAAAKLAFTQQPQNGSVRTPLATVKVGVTDAFGNAAPGATNAVTLVLNPVGGALSGTTVQNAVAGVAAFANLQVANEASGYTLGASAAGLVSAVSAAFTVVDNVLPGAPSAFALTRLGTFSIRLDWTASGDDGALGTATAYEARVSTTPFTQFSGGVLLTGLPSPAVSGTAQSFTAAGLLPNTTYYFALRAVDGVPNLGAYVTGSASTAACSTGYSGNLCTDCAGGYVKPSGQTTCVHLCTAQNPCTAPPLNTCASLASLNVRPNPGTCALAASTPFYTCDYTPTATACGVGKECTTPTGGASASTCTDAAPTYTLSGLATSATAGTATNVTLTVRDTQGQVYTTYRGTARFTSTDGQAAVQVATPGTPATVPLEYVFTAADAGVKTVAVTFKTVPATGTTQTLTATDKLLSTATASASTTVGPGAKAVLAWRQYPTTTNVRTALAPEPRVGIYDDFGNLVTSATDSVTLSLSANPGAATLGGTLTVAAVAGVASFPGITLDNEGTGSSLRAASFPYTAIVGSTFNVLDNLAPGPVTSFSVATTPRSASLLTLGWTAPGDDGALGNLRAGSAYVLKVSKTVITQANFASIPTTVTPPTIGAVGAAQVATASGLDSATRYYFALSVSDGAGNTSYAFVDGLTDACPTGYTGAACDQCASGYVKPSGQSTCVHVCTAQNPCTTPPASTCASVTTLDVRPNPGACAIAPATPFYACTYTPTPTLCGAGKTCENNQGVGACLDAAPSLTITGLPATTTAGVVQNVTVTVRDPQGAVYTGYTGTVVFSSNDLQAALPGLAAGAFTAGNAGVKTFAIIPKTFGPRTFTVTDQTRSSATATASTNVEANTADRLAFVQQPSGVKVRVGMTPAITVAITDPYGNRTADIVNVALELQNNPRGAVLDGTFNAATAGGLATFSALTLDQEGTGVTLRASSGSYLPALSSAFTVVDDTPPGLATGFGPFHVNTTQFQVQLDWNAPGDDGTLGNLPSGSSYVLKYATSVLTPANFGTTGTVVPTPVPGGLGFPESVEVTNLDANTTYYFALQVDDGAGNKSYTFTQETTAACEGGSAGPKCQSCAGGYVQTGGPGVCTHVCLAANPCTSPDANTCNGLGTLVVRPNPGLCAPQQTGLFYSCSYAATTDTACTAGTVCQATPTAACVASAVTYELSTLPGTVVAGIAQTVTLTIKDQLNRVYAPYRGTAHFSSTDLQGTVPGGGVQGDWTFTATESGVKSFANGLILRTAGPLTLTASEVGNASITTQRSTTVLAAGPNKLAIKQQPSGVVVRQSIAPPITVELQDAFGNASASEGSISVVLNSAPANATLEGLTPVTTVAALATFADLSVDQEGTGIRLRFASPSAAAGPVDSATFNVVDNVAPGTPVLTVPSAQTTQTAITLDWSAPGDDGDLGNLPATSSYVLKYSTSPISAANFATALGAVVVPTSAPGGRTFPETATASGLNANTTYHFALQVNDGAGNASYALATAATLACEPGYVGTQCQTCDNGYTLFSNLCMPICDVSNPCTGPAPASTCNTTTNALTTYPNPGVCTAAPGVAPYYACAYPANTPVSCTTSGKICLSSPTAACYNNPCNPNPCGTPAAAACTTDGTGVVTNTLTCAPLTETTHSCTPLATPTTCAPTGALCYNATCYTTSVPVAGDLIISEILHSPSSSPSTRQWFEVHNLSTKNLNIAGLTLKETSASQTFTLPATPPVIIPAGGYFVFGRTTDTATNGGAAVNYAYGSAILLGTSGTLQLALGTTTLESVTWDLTFPQTTGRAMNLSSNVQSAAIGHSKSWYWCNAATAMSGGDLGTPGAPNGDCGVPASPTVGFCNIQWVVPPDNGTKDLGTQFTTASFNIYSQIYSPPPDGTSMTTRNTAGNDYYPWLEAQIGYGTTDDATQWTTWTTVAPNPTYSSSGNNDEFLATGYKFGQAGTWKYGFRYRVLNPQTGAPGAYVYCDKSNIAASGTSTQWGTVTSMISPTQRITDARATADGTGLSLPIENALVTYVRTGLIGTDAAGFFVQAQQAGPALFVAVDPTTLTSTPTVGDQVSFTITTMATVGSMRQATALTSYSRISTGNSVTGLAQTVSAATDLVTGISNYEVETITLTGAISGAFASSGGSFQAAQITTAGYPTGDTLLRLRVPTTLRDSLDLAIGCGFTLNRTPLWRFGTQAQPSAWVAGDIAVSGCPAPKVVSAAATNLTTVLVTFDRNLSAAPASAFTIPGLTVNNAVITGRTVTLTTSSQSGGAAYTLTVGAALKDGQGTAIDGTAATASFTGFLQAAILKINELNPNIGSSLDLVELLVVQSGTTDQIKLQQDLTPTSPTLLATLPNVNVTAGDLIVIHLGAPTSTTETTSKTQCVAASCYGGAWDFNGGATGISFGSRVIVVRAPDGTVQDAVPFTTTGTAAAIFGPDVQALITAGLWGPACASGNCTGTEAQAISAVWTATGTVATGNSCRLTLGANTRTKADWTVTTNTFGLGN